jgi:predicted phage terminase large subunit-like protein
LERERRLKGPQVFSAQYQQNPVTPEGNMIRPELFGSYDEDHNRSWYHKVVQSWDTAVTDNPNSDYSVCTTWGFRVNKWYLLDVFRARLEYPRLKEKVNQLYLQWKPDKVLIEDANSGTSLYQELRLKRLFRPIMIRPRGDKVERVNGCLGEIKGGHILLPSKAPWLDTFLSELRAFPEGRHDDQVDSMSQFINWQLGRWRWILEERTPDGRRKRSQVRYRERPWPP